MPMALYSQTPETIQYSPGGLLDNVYDHYGNHYTLDDIKIPPISPNNGTEARWIDTNCTSGIFRLHFTAGSGFLDSESVDAPARRAVVCQVFNDLSNFIVSPLQTNGLNNRVEIWVRDINGLLGATTANPNPAATSNVLGMASGFNVVPAAPTSATVTGGIVDNEIWKTIHTGIDSYTNVVSPLIMTAGASSGSSGVFYHGYVTLNFSNPTQNWNLATTGTCPQNLYDLYSVVLHEVTHALGFASLMNNLGASRMGAGYNYYNRYDTFLQTATGTPLLTTTNACPMYNHSFTGGGANLHPGCSLTDGLQTGAGVDQTASCVGAIRYTSLTQNVPVYTPSCFETGSSLSHFEDACYPTDTPANNNTYFVMSNANGNGVAKRFLKPEERQTLCNIGYTTTTNHNGYNYTDTCTGIQVAGVNDGIISTGSNTGQYAYIGAGTTASPITLPINGAGGILSNDVYTAGTPADIRIEGLQDVYDATALINGANTPFSSATSVLTPITFSSTILGLHLLRYVPVVNGVRGNITYVYVYVIGSEICEPTVCNMISNGDFENATCGQLNSTAVVAQLNCWFALCGTPDLFTRTCTWGWLLKIPGISITFPYHYGAVETHNPSSNNAYGGFGAEGFQLALNTPLVPGQTYNLSFWGHAAYSDTDSYNGTAPFPVSIGSLPSLIAPVPSIWDHNSFLINTINVPNDGNWHNYSFNFTFNGSVVSNILSIWKSNSNNLLGFYIDDIILVPNNLSILSLPDTTCVNSAIDLSIYLNPAPAGGTFSWSLNGGAFTNITGTTFTPTTAGTYTITYTYNNNMQCPVTISDTIEVIVCTTFDAITACKGTTPAPTLPTSSTNVPAITGTWSPATIDTTTAGAFDYTFTPDAGQNASTTTMTVTVNTPITPAFTQVSPICKGDGLSDLPTTSTNGITGTWLPALDDTTTTTYTFTPDIGQCASNTSMEIIVNPKPNPGTLTGTNTICVQDTTTITSSISGGVWTTPDTNYISITNTTANSCEITGIDNTLTLGTGFATLTYTVTDPTTNCSRSVSKKIFINPLPTIISITSGNQYVCTNSNPSNLVNLSVNATGSGVTYQWYSNNIDSNIGGTLIVGAISTDYTPPNTSVGTTYYYVIVRNSYACSIKSNTIPVTVLDPPTLSSITGNSNLCIGKTTTLSCNPTGGVWSSSDNTIATVNNNGLVTGIGIGSVTISYTYTNNVCTNSTSFTMNIIGAGSLVAQDDNFTTPAINTLIGGQTPSILTNDTVNGIGATTSSVSISIINVSSVPAQSIQPPFWYSSGNIVVQQGTPVGTYTITYVINSSGCRGIASNTATVTFVVNSVPIVSPPIVNGVRADDFVLDVDTQSNGKIIISGMFDNYNNISTKKIARLNNDLTLDTTGFNVSGPIPANIYAYDMKIIKNSGANYNKILLGGWFDGWSGQNSGFGIVRLLSNGNYDTSFNTQSLATTTSYRGFTYQSGSSISKGMVFEVFVIPDNGPSGYAGKILVGGQFTHYNGYPAKSLVMLEPNGDYNPNPASLCKIFNTNVNSNGGFTESVGGIALQKIPLSSTQYLLIGGCFNYVNGNNYNGLVRLNMNGSQDFGFGSLLGQGLYTNSYPSTSGYFANKKSIVVQPTDGKIIVGGYFHKYNGTTCNNLVRLTVNGAYDNSFVTGTGFNNNTPNPITGSYGLVRDLYLDTTSMKLYACGDFTSYKGTACDEVVRINCTTTSTGGSGSKDANFNLLGYGPNGSNNGPVYCMKKQDDPKIIIGGKFTTYATIPALNVTRILPAAITGEAKNSSVVYGSEPEIDIFATTDIVLYPNPTDGLLYYKANDFGTEYTITVYDTMGRTVKSVEIQGADKENSIDFSNLPSGTYLVRFNNATQHITKTIIKK